MEEEISEAFKSVNSVQGGIKYKNKLSCPVLAQCCTLQCLKYHLHKVFVSDYENHDDLWFTFTCLCEGEEPVEVLMLTADEWVALLKF